MSDFEWWFLLIYTAYTVISIAVLMWVGREDGGWPPKYRARLSRQHSGVRR